MAFGQNSQARGHGRRIRNRAVLVLVELPQATEGSDRDVERSLGIPPHAHGIVEERILRGFFVDRAGELTDWLRAVDPEGMLWFAGDDVLVGLFGNDTLVYNGTNWLDPALGRPPAELEIGATV